MKIEDILINSYHKNIYFPDSLVLFYDSEKRNISSSKYLTENLKILSILGNDCQKCTVSELLFWDDFSMNHENIGIDLYNNKFFDFDNCEEIPDVHENTDQKEDIVFH